MRNMECHPPERQACCMYVKTRLKRLYRLSVREELRKCGKTGCFPSVQSHTSKNQTVMGVKPYVRPRLKGQVDFSIREDM